MRLSPFFRLELSSQMRRFEDVWYKRTKEGMEVYIEDEKAFFINKDGCVEQYRSDTKSEDCDEVNKGLISVVALIEEYDKAMSNAPYLILMNIYQCKLLAQYENIVLTGRELDDGSYDFSTWIQKDEDLICGQYFGNRYREAKENFAVRAGFVNEKKLFSDEEYVQIYYCMQRAAENGYGFD